MAKKKKNKQKNDKNKREEEAEQKPIDEFVIEEGSENYDKDNVVTLEIKKRNKTRVYEFPSEEERNLWYRAYCKRKLYTPYFLLGVGINALLYFGGLDISENIFWGILLGMGIPFLTMFLLAELHFKYVHEKKLNNG